MPWGCRCRSPRRGPHFPAALLRRRLSQRRLQGSDAAELSYEVAQHRHVVHHHDPPPLQGGASRSNDASGRGRTAILSGCRRVRATRILLSCVAYVTSTAITASFKSASRPSQPVSIAGAKAATTIPSKLWTPLNGTNILHGRRPACARLRPTEQRIVCVGVSFC